MLFNDRRKGLGQLSPVHGYMASHAAGDAAAGSPMGSNNQKYAKNAVATRSWQKGTAKRVAKGRAKDAKKGM